MYKIDTILLKSKFRGCLLGALLGDCSGAPFEGDSMRGGQKLVLQKYFDDMQAPTTKAVLKMQYTDDTAMTKSVAKCLIDKPAIDYGFMARLFVKEFFTEPKRGYGQNIVEVFKKLRTNKFEDIYKPAKEQFSGSGSYGNGGAMRIAPIALYFHNDFNAMIHAATKSTEITHTNKLGIHGALLQCIAIQQCLYCDPLRDIDVNIFISKVISRMRQVEVDDEDDLGIDDPTPYQTQLKLVQQLLNEKHEEFDEEYEKKVISMLGNSVSALYSVPSALFCFLKAQNEIPQIETDNVFRRTIQYAISLGGDTDTIASMAGALAGAYVGEENINKNLLKRCEFYKEMMEIADNLYTVIDDSPKVY